MTPVHLGGKTERPPPPPPQTVKAISQWPEEVKERGGWDRTTRTTIKEEGNWVEGRVKFQNKTEGGRRVC